MNVASVAMQGKIQKTKKTQTSVGGFVTQVREESLWREDVSVEEEV